MYTGSNNPASLFIPLLTDSNIQVREQAGLIFLGMYGTRSLTYLRRLLESPSIELRQQAVLALRQMADLSEIDVYDQPFPAISIECLGRVRLYVGAEEVRIDQLVRETSRGVGWQKVEAALAYLIHCGRRGTSVVSLGTAVWGSKVASTNVIRVLEGLRKVLMSACGEVLAARLLRKADDHWSFAVDECFSDVHAFEQTLSRAYDIDMAQGRAAAAALYAQALQLYGGIYMAGLLQDAPWARTRRADLRNGYLIAAECLMEYSFDCERYRDCIKLGSAIFDDDESAEEVIAWLLRAHHQLGEWSQVEYLYRRYLLANQFDASQAEKDEDAVALAYRSLQQLRKAA